MPLEPKEMIAMQLKPKTWPKYLIKLENDQNTPENLQQGIPLEPKKWSKYAYNLKKWPNDPKTLKKKKEKRTKITLKHKKKLLK